MRYTPFETEDQDLGGRIDEFMARFKIGTLLNRAGIKKMRGLKPLLVLRTIFELAFLGRNMRSIDFFPSRDTTGAGCLHSWLRWLSEASSSH
jgi:hypothetical protein